MYKWPQGRVIRTVSLVLILVIGVNIAWEGSYPQLKGWIEPGETVRHWSQLAIGIIYAVLALGVLIGGAVAAGFKPKTVDFLIEVEQEMTRVTWPTGSDLLRSTLVIAGMIVALAVLILAVDAGNLAFMKLIFHWKG